MTEPARPRGPYQTIGDVMAACTPSRRRAVEATLQFMCEGVEAWYRDWADQRAAETAIMAVYEKADQLRAFMDQRDQ